MLSESPVLIFKLSKAPWDIIRILFCESIVTSFVLLPLFLTHLIRCVSETSVLTVYQWFNLYHTPNSLTFLSRTSYYNSFFTSRLMWNYENLLVFEIAFRSFHSIKDINKYAGSDNLQTSEFNGHRWRFRNRLVCWLGLVLGQWICIEFVFGDFPSAIFLMCRCLFRWFFRIFWSSQSLLTVNRLIFIGNGYLPSKSRICFH